MEASKKFSTVETRNELVENFYFFVHTLTLIHKDRHSQQRLKLQQQQ